jgi:hypothetical protein
MDMWPELEREPVVLPLVLRLATMKVVAAAAQAAKAEFVEPRVLLQQRLVAKGQASLH